MVAMDITVKIVMIALIGLLIGAIVLYHVWLDGRLARERGATQAEAPPPAGEPAGGRDRDVTGGPGR